MYILSLSLSLSHVQVENDLGPAVFPNALIVGDCIITDLLGQFLLSVSGLKLLLYEALSYLV